MAEVRRRGRLKRCEENREGERDDDDVRIGDWQADKLHKRRKGEGVRGRGKRKQAGRDNDDGRKGSIVQVMRVGCVGEWQKAGDTTEGGRVTTKTEPGRLNKREGKGDREGKERRKEVEVESTTTLLLEVGSEGAEASDRRDSAGEETDGEGLDREAETKTLRWALDLNDDDRRRLFELVGLGANESLKLGFDRLRLLLDLGLSRLLLEVRLGKATLARRRDGGRSEVDAGLLRRGGSIRGGRTDG